jgi:hypothetical protein
MLPKQAKSRPKSPRRRMVADWDDGGPLAAKEVGARRSWDAALLLNCEPGSAGRNKYVLRVSYQTPRIAVWLKILYYCSGGLLIFEPLFEPLPFSVHAAAVHGLLVLACLNVCSTMIRSRRL